MQTTISITPSNSTSPSVFLICSSTRAVLGSTQLLSFDLLAHSLNSSMISNSATASAAVLSSDALIFTDGLDVMSSASTAPDHHQWLYRSNSDAIRTVQLAPDESVAFLVSATDIQAVDISTQPAALLWAAAVPVCESDGWRPYLTLSKSGAYVYAAANRSVLAWHAATGASAWLAPLPTDGCALHVAAGPLSTALVYAVSAAPQATASVFALRGRTGAVAWQWTLALGAPEAVLAPAVDPAGALYLAVSGVLLALSPLDGQELWRTPLAARAASPLALSVTAGAASGVLYMVDATCALLGVDSASGARRWHISLHGPAGVCRPGASALAIEESGAVAVATTGTDWVALSRLQQVVLLGLSPAVVSLTGGSLDLSGGNFAELFAAGATATCVFGGDLGAAPAVYFPPNASVRCTAPPGPEAGFLSSVALEVVLRSLQYRSNALAFAFDGATPVPPAAGADRATGVRAAAPQAHRRAAGAGGRGPCGLGADR
jgi:hypothetical protein